jgi:hypothetical protein
MTSLKRFMGEENLFTSLRKRVLILFDLINMSGWAVPMRSFYVIACMGRAMWIIKTSNIDP